MVRITIPTIPAALAPAHGPPIAIADAVERIATFLAPGNATVITGAGVSVDSGIRAYRGKDGRYMNPNYKPILYHEIVDEMPKGHLFRQRYWLRSYLGYPPVRDAAPNTTHYALAALQHTSIVPRLITQNVDGLHHKALRPLWTEQRMRARMLELHGTLHHVRCKHGHVTDRETFQALIGTANPGWKVYANELERTGQQPRTNPDGDVELEGVDYGAFIVPDCPECTVAGRRNDVHKPDLIFFGESIPQEVKQRSFDDVDQCDRLFLVGTTLATFSAFRLLRHALDAHKPVLLLNLGPTRAEGLPGVQKLDVPSGAVLRGAVRALLGTRVDDDPEVRRMLASGVYKPPVDDRADATGAPRAEG